ncbi:MAG TPA: helix-turn-helix domain-containing protein [Gemmatimonadales bacterium]
MPNDTPGPTQGPTQPATPSRERLIEAAARVYAACGFRGATTRRIAEEAGVNEVTIFRLFGSKASLIEEAMRHAGMPVPGEPTLPEVPRDPERELTKWCTMQLSELRERRAFIRQVMGDLEEKPEVAPCLGQSADVAGRDLKRYMRALCEHGFVEYEPAETGRSEEAHAAGAMLMASLFGDAMGRDVTPDLYPQPPERAPALYVGLFLRALRCRSQGAN